ncbi:minor capsid protein [Moorena sp. SIO3A2]|uniref:minor capsid protein n=1 Tax=Moorena sp. SIO3A2 TaxID=2607841 RepID=UPI0013B86908|nr:minor capsid protein [Moorena sp. SIO3A2]NER90381.1 hypothetical protein [Moorena sp. SIO3A2]
MDTRKILDLAEEYNDAIATLEQKAISRLVKSIESSYRQLSKEFHKKYPKLKKASNILPAQRLQLIQGELGDLLQVVKPQDKESAIESLTGMITEADRLGAEETAEIVKAIDPDFKALSFSRVPITAAAIAADQSYQRLLGGGTAFAERASIIISEGMIQGLGNQRVAAALKKSLEITRRQAERIARTESANAAIGAAKVAYASSDIEYGIWLTLRQDVCAWCVAKSGKIYKITSMVIPQHFNCRCSIMPVTPEWVRNGLIDFDAIDTYSEALAVREGRKQRTDLAPFEVKVPREVSRERLAKL